MCIHCLQTELLVLLVDPIDRYRYSIQLVFISGFLNIVRTVATFHIAFIVPICVNGIGESKMRFSLILLIARSTCILILAMDSVSLISSGDNCPLEFKKGGMFKVHPFAVTGL